MTGRKHRANMELSRKASPISPRAFFGGISVTGTIARTATNIRAGAASPMSGHPALRVCFAVPAGGRAPRAVHIRFHPWPGVLVVVCWNMAEKKEFGRLMGSWRTAAVLLATFVLTLVKDLTFGIVAGCVLAALFALFKHPVPEEGE